MPTLAEFQHRFAESLGRGDLGASVTLFTNEPDRLRLGLKVYANNVAHGLVSALESSFPAVRAYAGAEGFRAAAIAYVRETPPADPVLLRIGRGFPAFLSRWLRLAAQPCLPDLAAFELAWLGAYHAAEAVPITLADLGAVSPAQLMASVLTLHPSAHLLASPWPLDRLWLAARTDDARPEVVMPEPEPVCFLIYRPEADVLVQRLSPALFAALEALQAGHPFGESVAGLDPVADMPPFQALAASGLFVALNPETPAGDSA